MSASDAPPPDPDTPPHYSGRLVREVFERGFGPTSADGVRFDAFVAGLAVRARGAPAGERPRRVQVFAPQSSYEARLACECSCVRQCVRAWGQPQAAACCAMLGPQYSPSARGGWRTGVLRVAYQCTDSTMSRSDFEAFLGVPAAEVRGSDGGVAVAPDRVPISTAVKAAIELFSAAELQVRGEGRGHVHYTPHTAPVSAPRACVEQL